MQFPPLKVAILEYNMRNVLKPMKKQRDMVDFVLKILIKLTKISMNYQIIYFVNLFIFTKLFVLSPIFLATRSKCVSENFEKIKNSFAKTHLLKIFSSNYFFQVPIHKEF